MGVNEEKGLITPAHIYTRCINYNKNSNWKIFTLLIFMLPNCTRYETGPDMFPYLSKYLNGINDVMSEHIFMIWNGDNTTIDHVRCIIEDY